MLPALLALAVIVSGDGTTGGSPASGTTPASQTAPSQGSGTGSSSAATGTSAASSTNSGSSAASGSGVAIVDSGTGQRTPVPTGGPVAYFVATSPVAPGAPVSYTDESYDTTAGATIVDRSWQGRQGVFAQPGVYTVSLTITDSYGRESTYSSDVLVSGSSAEASPGQPSAFFLVTSPVTAGSLVTYTDESYDLDPRASIVNEIWSGRQTTFSAPGTYPVSLRVEDSTGAWSSTFTRDVVVLPGAAQPVAASTARPPVWTASASPDPASPGMLVTVTADSADDAAAPPALTIPSALQGTWGGVSYAAENASGPMIASGPGMFTRTIEVPNSAAFPVGTYDLLVQPMDGGQPVTVALVVQASALYIEPIVSGA